jgi:hypothetical protein
MAMKKITFRAEAEKLELARLIAESKGTTLEDEIRQWLNDYGERRWKSSKRHDEGNRPGK